MLSLIKQKIDSIEVNDKTAPIIVKAIPGSCVFHHHFKIGKWEFESPSLCRINPFFDNLMMLRFKALCYLDEHGVGA